MTEHIFKTWTIKIAFIESIILSVALVDAIDIMARVLAALAALVIAFFTVRKMKAETRLAETKLKREEFEKNLRELEVEEKFKEVNNIKS